MYLIGAIAIAAIALLWLRKPLARPMLARVRIGDAVKTQDGAAGTVVEILDSKALIAIDNHNAGANPNAPPTGVWVKSSLLSGNRDAPVASVTTRDSLIAFASPPVVDLSTTRLQRVGMRLYACRKTVVFGTAAATVLMLPFAMGAPKALTTGGFVMPHGEAMTVEHQTAANFKLPASNLALLIQGDDAAKTKAKAVRLGKHVTGKKHLITPGEPMLSKDGKSALVLVGLDTTQDAEMFTALQSMETVLKKSDATTAPMAGRAVFAQDVNNQMQRDLRRAELVGVPVALIVLLLVFGTISAAVTALVIGAASTVFTLALIHLYGLTGDVSLFVINIATMLGFGLGIDYSLLTIQRFRAELNSKGDVRAATIQAVEHAGRTICVSSIAIALGLSGLFMFHIPALKSIAIGGILAVIATATCALVVAPASLALIGYGIERGALRNKDSGSAGWRMIAEAVMKRPAAILVGLLGTLILVSFITMSATFELPRPSMLPKHVDSRTAQRAIENSFPKSISSPILVMVDHATPAQEKLFMARVKKVKNVGGIAPPTRKAGMSLFVVTAKHQRQGGPLARKLVHDLRELNGVQLAGDGRHTQVRVGGQFAEELEFFVDMKDNALAGLAVVLGSAFFVLMIAFRSVVVPLKAIFLDVVSICATLGIVVWASNHGWLGPTNTVDASLPLLLFCLLFGLSMDYEVFMLARVAENWQGGMNNEDATVKGLVTIAPLVTGAAMILVVLGLAFTTTELAMVRQIGFGVATALLIDATLMRALLVPAAMKLLGDLNWWAPDWLARRLSPANWA